MKIINSDMWICGDLHNKIELFLQNCKKYNIRDSAIIILGDSEVGFRKEQPNKFYNYFSKQLTYRNNTVYLVRGNHDNPEHWSLEKSFKLESKWPNIIHLADNSIIEINNKQYFIFGGAVSIDRAVLNEDSTWFRKELTTLPKLKDKRLNIFGVLAHTGLRPTGLDPNVLKRRCKVDKRLIDDIELEVSNCQKITEDYSPKIWYNGHYHCSSEDFRDTYKQITLDICEFIKID